ncbi:hypothetical protein BJX76DRAFT_349125 [Aspergillus varians]
MTRSDHHSRLSLLTYPERPAFASCSDGGYFFAPLDHFRYDMGVAGAHVDDLTPDQRAKEAYIHDAEDQGKKAFFKEHMHILISPAARISFVLKTDDNSNTKEKPLRDEDQSSYYNETFLPDNFLSTLKPTFLIRHPALAVPSYYRAARKADGDQYLLSDQGQRMCRNVVTVRWSRQLYGFYAERLNAAETERRTEIAWPLVSDADDIMTKPAVVTRFCEILGLDTTRLRFQWDKDEQKQRPEILAYRSTIDGSTGIDARKAYGESIDLDESARQWKEEFGEGPGGMIKKHVREAKADYEVLKEKRLRA